MLKSRCSSVKMASRRVLFRGTVIVHNKDFLTQKWTKIMGIMMINLPLSLNVQIYFSRVKIYGSKCCNYTQCLLLDDNLVLALWNRLYGSCNLEKKGMEIQLFVAVFSLDSCIESGYVTRSKLCFIQRCR